MIENNERPNNERMKGNPMGQSGLGHMYLHGKGVPKVCFHVCI